MQIKIDEPKKCPDRRGQVKATVRLSLGSGVWLDGLTVVELDGRLTVRVPATLTTGAEGRPELVPGITFDSPGARDDWEAAIVQQFQQATGCPAEPAPRPAEEKPDVPGSPGGSDRPAALRIEPEPARAAPRQPAGRLVIHFDGGSRGNPGDAASAVVLEAPGMEPVHASRYLGVETNNVAEYNGVILGVEEALKLRASGMQ
ncbi:MAG: hypothetical protein HY815_33700, partial [Candidatus Riflebacteria bacterium]|nr:hypothetical protein [Candidatus Riflebacteria bacterium]